MTNKIEMGNPEVTDETNILDIEIPDQMRENVSTGHPQIDALCAGNGMTPSTVMLLTGLPGAGKSTLALQLADSIRQQGHCSVVNACEESLYQVRKTAARLDLKHGFIPSYESEVHKLVEKAEAIRLKNIDKKMFLIVDSLQTLEYEKEEKTRGRPLSDQNAAVEAAFELTKWAKKTYSVVIMIGQVTKDGTFEGKNKIKHLLDAHLHLGIDKDRKSPTYGQRVAEMQKNRFGPAGLYMEFEIKSTGLYFPVASNP